MAILWTPQKKSVCPTTAPSVTSSSQFWEFLWHAVTCSTPTWRTCSRCRGRRSTNRWETAGNGLNYRLESYPNPRDAALYCPCLWFQIFFQVTLSYGMFENKSNIINLKGAFSVEEDTSRWDTPFELPTSWMEKRMKSHWSSTLTFDLLCLLQVQVCALSPVPRHPVVSPSGCLLGRLLLSHPRPRHVSVSERREGTSVWY